MASKTSTLMAILKFNDQFSSGYAKAIKNLTSGQKQFISSMDRMKQAGEALSSIGNKLTLAVTLPIVALGTKAVHSAGEYEKSINQIMTLQRKFASNGEIDLNNAESIESFKNKAKSSILDLSNTYGRTQTEIASSYYTLASAFNDTSKMEEALNTSLQMSIAGNVDAGTSAKALATIYNAYGGSITEIGDKIGATVNFGFTTYEELADSLGTVVPTAAQAKVSFDDLSTAMAVITSTGVSTAEATTYLKNAMNQIIQNGDMGKIQDGHFLEYLSELEDTIPGIDQQMKVFKNIRARSGITALVGNTSLYAEYSKQIKNASGTLKEMNDQMMKSSAYQFQIAMNKLSNILEKVGEKLMPFVNKYLSKFTEWLDKIEITDDKIESWIRWGIALAAIGPALKLIGSGMSAFGTIGKVAPVFGNMLGIGGAAAGGAGGAVAGGSGAVAAGLLPIVAGIAAIVAIIAMNFDKIKPALGELKEKALEFWEVIKPLREMIGTYLYNNIRLLGDMIVTIINSLTEALSGISMIIRGICEGDFSMVIEGIKKIGTAIINVILSPIRLIIGQINNALSAIGSIKVPDWVPIIGGKSIEMPQIPQIPEFATGTPNFAGGMALVGERGPELITLPSGSRVDNAENTKNKMGVTINIPKLADSIVVRAEEDIDLICDKLANKLRMVYVNS